jgi:hypothetical protein
VSKQPSADTFHKHEASYLQKILGYSCPTLSLSQLKRMAAEGIGVVQGTAMEISVSKFELLKELTATQGVVERKTTIPILSNFS